MSQEQENKKQEPEETEVPSSDQQPQATPAETEKPTQTEVPEQQDAGKAPGDTPEPAKKAEKTYAGMTRRTFALGIGGFAVMMGIGSLTFVGRDPIIRPPGGQDEDRLVSACIRCEKCYEICPRDVIAPAHIENGIVTMRTPTFDFSRDFCDYCEEENGGDPLCVKVCSTQALKLPDDATAENVIIGKAIINEDWCLAYKLIGCRFCYDACPYEAMELDSNGRPYMIYDKCNGCGACYSVCVSLQNASIAEGATDRAIVVYPEAIYEQKMAEEGRRA